MIGDIIAFDPCNTCEHHDMCSRCELTLRRDGALITNKWISVEERLPDNHTVCLVYSAKCGIDYYHNGFCVPYVTHWMPLPEAPKMEGGGE